MCETGDGSFVQAGIVAVGIGCGDEVPGLYVNVASYVCWIKEIVERVGIFFSYQFHLNSILG